jgi:hypothetical protein
VALLQLPNQANGKDSNQELTYPIELLAINYLVITTIKNPE